MVARLGIETTSLFSKFRPVLSKIVIGLCFVTLIATAANDEVFAKKLSSLIEPSKLATLGQRKSNPRIQKAVAILEESKREGYDVATVASNAVVMAGYTNAHLATLTRESLVRNYSIAERLGVLNPTGLNDMRKGQSPTIKCGPYAGDELSVDHIVPRAVAPELDNVIANLELMPLRMNESKNAKIGERQVDYAKKFRTAGVISAKRLNEILKLQSK